MEKIFQENAVEFTELFDCGIYVFLWKGNPLAQKELIEFEDLKDYPCLSFEQGDENSFYFAEEVFSTYDYKQIIKTDDRATILNLMIGLNGYTLCYMQQFLSIQMKKCTLDILRKKACR